VGLNADEYHTLVDLQPEAKKHTCNLGELLVVCGKSFKCNTAKHDKRGKANQYHSEYSISTPGSFMSLSSRQGSAALKRLDHV